MPDGERIREQPLDGDVVDVLDAVPRGLSDWAVLRFGADYGAEHPIWSRHGLEDLESMRLPAALTSRLKRWAQYWDDHNDFELGWTSGHPETWWREEQRALPRDLAEVIGPDVVLTSEDGALLRSRAPGTSPAAAAAARQKIGEGEAEDREHAELQRGGHTVAANVSLRFRSPGGAED